MSSRLALVPAFMLAFALACVLAVPASADAEVLKRGSHGPVVAQLQQRLGVPADGVFGPQTGHAVRRFQARKGLTVDGIVGLQTAHALGIDLAEGHTAGGGSHVDIPPALER